MFERTKFFIIDIDGTVCLGDEPIAGTAECLRRIEESGRTYYFFSNNSSGSIDSIRARLAKLGFPVPREKIMLSSYVAAQVVLRDYPGKRVYLLGNRNLHDCFVQAGVPLTQEEPDIVLVGYDLQLSQQRIRTACRFLERGAIYIATHPDRWCPTPDGYIPDIGATLELLEARTGRRPIVAGKPMTPTVDYLTQTLGCARGELAFIGDRLETDIRIGADHGIPTVLVLTGVTDAETAAASPVQADLVLPSMRELPAYLPPYHNR